MKSTCQLAGLRHYMRLTTPLIMRGLPPLNTFLHCLFISQFAPSGDPHFHRGGVLGAALGQPEVISRPTGHAEGVVRLRAGNANFGSVDVD